MSRSRRADIPASLWFYAVIGAWSIAMAPIGALLFALRLAAGSGWASRLARRVNWLYGKSSVILMRPVIKVRKINQDAAKNIGPCVIVANHQSMLDLYMLGAQGCDQVTPVAKKWPFRLLPFTLAMRAAGYVDAESLSGEEVMKKCRKLIKEGAALVFYPEGRRSRGGGLGRFHTGAARLALAERLPVVPMVIKGSGRALPPGRFLLEPGGITVEMLPPIMPEEYGKFSSELLPHRAMTRYIREIFKKKLEE